MRRTFAAALAMLLLSSTVALAAPPSHAGGPPAHVCENNPKHWSCDRDTTTTVAETTTTTTVATTTTTEATTTTTEAPTTTTTVAPTTTTSSTTTTTLAPTTTTTTLAPTTTTTLAPTTTTTVAPTRTVLWTGNRVEDWYSTANSGGGDQWNVADGVEQYNPAIDGSNNHGARLNHQGFGSSRVLPTEAWYSVDIRVPAYAGAQDNVFQFKQGDGSTRRHLWNFGWRPDGDGNLQGIIRTRLSGDQWGSLQDPAAFLNWTVPIGEWFRVEVFRRISTGADGRYEVRIDGVLVYEFSGPTAASNLDPRPAGNHEWVVSHYLGRGYHTDGSVGPTSVFFRNATIEE